MEMIKKYAGILMMLTLLVGFTSCEDDEDIYDDLMGRTWVGDLWFGSNNNPIESGIRLDNNGLGIDYQVFDYDGRPAGDLPFRWWVDYGTLYLDYGYDFALREIRGPLTRTPLISRKAKYLQGDLYLDGEYIDYIELQMQ